MVTKLGMSDKLGTLLYDSSSEEVFLGHSVAQSKNISEVTANLIDQEVKKLIDDANIKCKKILTEKIEDLHTVAKGLIEYETLTFDEVKDLLKGIPPSRDDFDDNSNTPKPSPTSSVPKTSNKISPQTQ